MRLWVRFSEGVRMPGNVARIGIVWRKENDGATLEDYLRPAPPRPAHTRPWRSLHDK